MRIDLESMAIEMPRVAGHPNRQPWRGVLTLLDVVSDKPPSGARGHRVVLTKAAADRALPSLLGMALDFTPNLDGHDARRKVGVITRAEITRGASLFRPSHPGTWQLEVGGYLYGRDFPELVEMLRGKSGSGDMPRARYQRSELGMSYELAEAKVLDASAEVWTLTDAIFTGAAILQRKKAAYQSTWIELENAAVR